MAERSTLYLRRVADNATVEAELIDSVTMAQAEAVQAEWAASLRINIASGTGLPEHAHWNWALKAKHYLMRPGHRLMGIEREGQMQGLMLLAENHPCRLATQVEQQLIYVHYLATAPWNLRSAVVAPRYANIGRSLVSAAVQYSIYLGSDGRIGLHSLPQAEPFYIGCGMTDLGKDEGEWGLRYYEMTPEQARVFVTGGAG